MKSPDSTPPPGQPSPAPDWTKQQDILQVFCWPGEHAEDYLSVPWCVVAVQRGSLLAVLVRDSDITDASFSVLLWHRPSSTSMVTNQSRVSGEIWTNKRGGLWWPCGDQDTV